MAIHRKHSSTGADPRIAMKKLHIKARISDLYAFRYEPEHVRAIANLYWRSVVITAFCAALLVSAFAVFEYRRAAGIIAGSAEPVAVSVPSITREALQSALSDFESRKAKFERLRAGAAN